MTGRSQCREPGSLRWLVTWHPVRMQTEMNAGAQLTSLSGIPPCGMVAVTFKAGLYINSV